MRSLISALTAPRDRTPVSYSPYGTDVAIPFGTVTNGEKLLRTMGSVGVLFAIVAKNASSVASAEWCLVRDPSPRAYKNTDPVEVTNHPALDLWNKPNKFFGRAEFVETFQQHLDLTGEAWWIIPKRATLPMGIWPIRPDRMEVVPDKDKFISHYIYRGPNGQGVRLEVDEVIQIRMPNPLDVYRGMGPVQAVLADIDSAKFSAEWNKNFFKNSAQPSGILKFDHELDDDEYRKVAMRWREQHAGVANAHRVAIIDSGEWVDTKFTMEDMQFKELRDISREIIREAFTFPKPMLGTVEDVNRANAEAAEVIYARWTLIPRLERIKSVLNNEFLPMFGATGQGVHFEYKSPVPEDLELKNATIVAQSEAARNLITIGFDPKAVCKFLGIPDMPFEAPVVKPTAPPALPETPDPNAPDQMAKVIQEVLAQRASQSNFANAILNHFDPFGAGV